MYRRGSEEFSRVVSFSDAVFAIAMTLLVIGITVPTLQHGGDVGELADALGDLIPNFVGFFIGFIVVGFYWSAHHQAFARLEAVDRGLVGINLVYLAFIAFLPFPTALLGTYFENPLSITAFAATVAVVSGLEVVELRHAHRHGLMQRRMPENVYRWSVLMGLSPLLFLLLSIPLAFLSTALAVASWFLSAPLQILANRWKPAGADEYQG